MNKIALLLLSFSLFACKESAEGNAPVSASGVRKTNATVQVGSDGLTVEQRNIKMRLERDNKVGSIKHLYVISTISGQVLIYSTVQGKVTSSSKRLTPSTVRSIAGEGFTDYFGFVVDIGGNTYMTEEVLGDDGTYGSSGDYLYWLDSKDVYHQHYLSGDQMVHISDQPMAVKGVIINMETMSQETEAPDAAALKAGAK